MNGTRDLIIATLTTDGPAADIADLARRIGKSVSTTRSSLARLIVAKKVAHHGNEGYALPGVAPAAAPPPKPVILRTHWILLGDRSGSMRSLEGPTLNEMNRTLDSIALMGSQPNQEVVVSYWEFGTTAEPLFRSLPANQVRHLTSYCANLGGTAMFDAMGDAITQAETDERTRPETAFVLMVLTDGEENDSRRWARNTGYAFTTSQRDVSKILELIRRVQATDKWTVALQVPRGYKAKLCRDFSIPEGNVVEWDQSERGAREAGAVRSAGIRHYAAQRAAGQSSVRSMFVTTDLSKVTSTDVRSNLDNVTARVKIYTVQKEEDIKSFVERETGRPFVRGTSFYQLTKTESRVQPDKILLVMEKGKKDVWGGDAARQLLGLPTGVHCRVKPGNHANFDMFIQSKSDNRKMVRGTKLIHAPLGL